VSCRQEVRGVGHRNFQSCSIPIRFTIVDVTLTSELFIRVPTMSARGIARGHQLLQWFTGVLLRPTPSQPVISDNSSELKLGRLRSNAGATTYGNSEWIARLSLTGS
jgi:hypothetical protein